VTSFTPPLALAFGKQRTRNGTAVTELKHIPGGITLLSCAGSGIAQWLLEAKALLRNDSMVEDGGAWRAKADSQRDDSESVCSDCHDKVCPLP